jgi:hypothetical protein
MVVTVLYVDTGVGASLLAPLDESQPFSLLYAAIEQLLPP